MKLYLEMDSAFDSHQKKLRELLNGIYQYHPSEIQIYLDLVFDRAAQCGVVFHKAESVQKYIHMLQDGAVISNLEFEKEDLHAMKRRVNPTKPRSPPKTEVTASCSLPDEDEAAPTCDTLTCKVCLTTKVGVTFIPCGHLVTCAKCAMALPTCPICRKDILGSVTTPID